MTFKKNITAEYKYIAEGLDFIEDTMKNLKYPKKLINEAMMLSEESMVNLLDHLDNGDELAEAEVELKIKRHYGYLNIYIAAPGSEISLSASMGDLQGKSFDDRQSESVIRKIFLQSYSQKVTYSRKEDYNYFDIVAGRPEAVMAIRSLFALVFAVVLGCVLPHFVPSYILSGIDSYLLAPIEQIFLNVLSFIAGPTIFLVIALNVTKFKSFRDPNHISFKVMLGFVGSSILAVGVGYLSFLIIKPGELGALSSYLIGDTFNKVQILDVLGGLGNLIPANIIEPFINNNAIQIMIMAVLVGIVLGRSDEYSDRIIMAIEALNNLCSRLAAYTMKAVSIAVFASVLRLFMREGWRILDDSLQLIITLILGIVMIGILYIIIMFVFAGLNPVPLLKKYFPVMVSTFFAGSEIDTMPKTLACCRRKLGIAENVCNFSIPYGSIINADGNCVYLMISCLFIAQMCGLEFGLEQMMQVAVLVLILSIGAPMTPGSVLLCLTVMLNHMGISLAALGLVIGINMLMEMLFSVSNSMGDVVISIVIAKREKMFNQEKYYS